jgi:flagella basal body P-ring formation protein FlgA
MRLSLLLVAIGPGFACGIVDVDHILGKDVSAASAVFAALDPKLEIGAAPLAGVQRVLRPDELVRLAKLNGIALDGPVSGICFERATETLTAEKLLPELQKTLAIDNANIEILDFSRFGIPSGTFEFPKSSLMPNGLWRGRVLYGENHSMPVWVKTRITVQRTWVEAGETLAVGKAIEASQLNVKTGPRFPFDTTFIESMQVLVGRRPVRTLAAGTPIAPAMLTIAHDVERGDRVEVEVTVGRAILDFEATAESSGRTGDSIMVKNPENGRSFQAKIQDKGHVLVER